MAVTDEQLAEIFFAESEELLTAANEALLNAEADGRPDESLPVLFRAFHSIKGGAMSLDLNELTELAHRLEDLLDLARQGAVVVDGRVVNLVFSAIDIMDGLLKSYGGKMCKLDAAESDRLALMEEIAGVVEGKSKEPCVPEPVLSGESTQKIDPDKRLAYCEIDLAQDADMPEIRIMLILKRLEEVGQIVYSYPETSGLMQGIHAGDRLVKAIVASDLDDEAIAKALDVTGVIGSRVAGVAFGDRQKTNVQLPSLQAIISFQKMVVQLAETLTVGVDLLTASAMCKALGRWGEGEGTAAGWYPGGLQAWTLITGMMDMCVKLHQEQQEQRQNSLNLQPMQDSLRGLWQSVFNVLRGVRYYQLFEPADMSLGEAMSGIVSQLMENKEARHALVDLNGVHTLEARDLRALITACALLANRGVSLAMFAGGQVGRRHHNVLEALNEITGGLVVWPTAFEASWRMQAN